MDLLGAYETLGLPIGAGADASKIAYRKLRAYWHPDRNTSEADAGTRFNSVLEAYKLLERAGFPDADNALNRVTNGSRAAGPGTNEPRRSGDDWYYRYYRTQSGSAEATREQARGHRQVSRTVKLSLEEAAFGTVLTLDGKMRHTCGACEGKKVVGEKLCPKCAGRAFLNTARVEYDATGRPSTTYACINCNGLGVVQEKCRACSGTGTEATSRDYSIRVRIPAGVTDGTELVLRSAGSEDDANTPRDVRVTVELKPHDLFWFDSDGYLCCSVPVTLLQYATEDAVMVPTLWGEESVTLQPGVRMVELSRRGFPGRNGERFPMRVHVEVDERPMPEAKLAKVRKALRSVQAGQRHQPRAQREWTAKVAAWRKSRTAQQQ